MHAHKVNMRANASACTPLWCSIDTHCMYITAAAIAYSTRRYAAARFSSMERFSCDTFKTNRALLQFGVQLHHPTFDFVFETLLFF